MLKHHDAKGDDALGTDKRRAAVKDLYARILVAIRSAESISRRIDKLRDEELQPQIHELLQGFAYHRGPCFNICFAYHYNIT